MSEEESNPGSKGRLVDEEFQNWLHAIGEVCLLARSLRVSIPIAGVGEASPIINEGIYADRKYGAPELIQLVHRFAQSWTIVVGELVGGIGVLCNEEEVIVSWLPVVRMIEEYAARVAWLLDDAITADQRIARALLDELRGFDETVASSSRMVGRNTGANRHFKGQLQKTRELILSHFPDALIVDDSSKWSIGGETFASPTETARQFGAHWTNEREWRGTYDHLSACCHPGNAILEFFDADANGTPLGISTKLTAVNFLVSVAMISFRQSIMHLIEYCGLPREDFDLFTEVLEAHFPGILADRVESDDD